MIGVTGGCRCGATRYSPAIEASPPIYCCHCLDCQSWSGSAFSEQAVFRADVILVSGPVVDYIFESRGGAMSHQRLCGTCYARIFNTNTLRPGIALLRAGTLDESNRIVPLAHIWVKRKQPWIALPEHLPAFDENPPLAEFSAILTRPTS